MKRHILALCLALTAQATAADEISDTLQSALDAYNEGDLKYALEELEYAKQQMLALKTDALGAFLPDPPEGWTREVNTEMNAGLGMMGGGIGAEAEYRGPDDSFTLTIMADNPMIAAMSAMIGNAAAFGAKIERVGREKFMVKDGTVQALIDNRILVKAEGGDTQRMLDLLGGIDFRDLARFGG